MSREQSLRTHPFVLTGSALALALAYSAHARDAHAQAEPVAPPPFNYGEPAYAGAPTAEPTQWVHQPRWYPAGGFDASGRPVRLRVRRPWMKFLVTGTLLQGISHIAAYAYAYGMLHRPSYLQREIGGLTLIPIAGPFVAAGTLATTQLINRDVAEAALVIDGLVQIGSAILLIRGIYLSAARAPTAASPTPAPPAPTWSLLPMAPGGLAGVTLSISAM